MRVRKLDKNGDMTFGRGQSNFYKDQPEGVGQCVRTRLQLYTGDWFLDVDAGMPWRTQVLGKFTNDVRDPVVKSRILGTPGVSSIVSYASQESRDTRDFTVQTAIETIYGSNPVPITVNTPVLSALDVRSYR